jgi:hypothetical protein
MFAVIYRGFLLPECEEEYQQAWKKIAEYFIKHCGAVGSCLHKTHQNEWVAYSRWPDLQTRDTAWLSQKKLYPEIKLAIKQLKDCIDYQKPHEEICMEVVEDFLFGF